jgi:predicted peptidase
MFTSRKVWDAGVAAKAYPSPAGRHGQPNLSHSDLYLCNNEYLQALEAVIKSRSAQKCHSERSEESLIFSDLRFCSG